MQGNENICRLEKVLIFLFIFNLIFLQRLAIPFGPYQFTPIFLYALFFALALYILGRAEIHPQRMVLLLFSIAGVFLASVYASLYLKDVSIASLLFLTAFYIPFLFVSKKKGIFAYIVKIFQGSMLIVAICGIMQFLIQLIGGPYIDPIQRLVPEAFRLYGYANQLPIFFGSEIMKSNGLFMLEPSFYSKFIATAIIIEFITRKRVFILIIFSTALLFCFSGTGLILLGIAAIPLLFRMKPVKIIFLAILLTIPTYVFFDQGYGDVFVERLEEFSNPNQSGYIRFVAPWLTFQEFLTLESPGTILFGNGAGTLPEYQGREYTFDELSGHYKTAHAFSAIKLFVEYGLVGGFLFFIFLIYIFVNSKQNRLLTFTLFINYSFLTISLQQPQTVYLCFILCIISMEKWEDSVAVLKQSKKKRKSQSLLNQRYTFLNPRMTYRRNV